MTPTRLFAIALIAVIGLMTVLPTQAQQVTTLTAQPFVASGDLAVDGDGNIFVANFGSLLNNANGAQVYRVTPEGVVSVFATGFAGASGNTFDTQGNLFQSNIAGGRISRITPDGAVTTFADGSDGIVGPVGLSFDSAGNLFVANCGNSTIRRITPAGVSTQFAAGAPLSCPNGLTTDDNDNLYAANFNNGQVIRITPAGAMSVFAITPPGLTKTNGGNGHIIYGNDRLYVVSNATQQIFELDVDTAELTLLAGAGGKGRKDGPLLQARFSLPNGIDLSPDGRLLYVNDSETLTGDNNIAPNVVRVIELPNIAPAFEINAGLNDAWYNPLTSGQGVFIIVFPEIKVFSMAMFTFDTQLPDPSAMAEVGDPGHRWFTAQGSYEGNRAEMDLIISSGGLFDDGSATVDNQVDGTVIVEFEGCNAATVSYDITSIDRQGDIPIERITMDNVELCEALQAL